MKEFRHSMTELTPVQSSIKSLRIKTTDKDLIDSFRRRHAEEDLAALKEIVLELLLENYHLRCSTSP
jgi:hypothetical protein